MPLYTSFHSLCKFIHIIYQIEIIDLRSTQLWASQHPLQQSVVCVHYLKKQTITCVLAKLWKCEKLLSSYYLSNWRTHLSEHINYEWEDTDEQQSVRRGSHADHPRKTLEYVDTVFYVNIPLSRINLFTYVLSNKFQVGILYANCETPASSTTHEQQIKKFWKTLWKKICLSSFRSFITLS